MLIKNKLLIYREFFIVTTSDQEHVPTALGTILVKNKQDLTSGAGKKAVNQQGKLVGKIGEIKKPVSNKKSDTGFFSSFAGQLKTVGYFFSLLPSQIA